MTITNLALQRRRWNELKEIFKDNKTIIIIGPTEHKGHQKFTISFDRLTYIDIQKLEDNGWSIIKVIPSTSYSVLITVSKYDLEKNSEYVQHVAEKYNVKSYWRLTNKINELRIINLEQTLRTVKQEKFQLQKQLENLQLTYEIIGIHKEDTKAQ